MSEMDHYERDFEEPLLADTANYYKVKAADWITQDSCPDYMLKAEVGGAPCAYNLLADLLFRTLLL